MGEATGELGGGFPVEVARAWEHAPTPVRKVALRMAVVLEGVDQGADVARGDRLTTFTP